MTRSKPTFTRGLLVATDARLRARLRATLEHAFPNAAFTERRDLRDNQTVWDIRSDAYQLLLVQCRAEDRDELEFLSSLNDRGLGRSGVVILAETAQVPAIERENVGAFEFLDPHTLDKTQLTASVKRVLRYHVRRGEDALPEADALLPPELAIKGYQPVRTLSVTNESSVLLVRSARTNQQFVLKFLADTGNERLVKRFLQECRIATTQHHRNIVTVHEQGLSTGAAYYVMEFLAGGSLQSLLRRRLPLVRTLRSVTQLAAALQHLHDNDIMHLDVKTANVLYRDEKTAVLIDFGAARHALINRNYTLKDHALGTPHYMSPEQATGRPLDRRADLYALGIVFFEMLTGECPYVGNTISEVLYGHLRKPIPELPDGLHAFQPIVNRLLAKKPSARYATAAAVARALHAASIVLGARPNTA